MLEICFQLCTDHVGTKGFDSYTHVVELMYKWMVKYNLFWCIWYECNTFVDRNKEEEFRGQRSNLGHSRSQPVVLGTDFCHQQVQQARNQISISKFNLPGNNFLWEAFKDRGCGKPKIEKVAFPII